jgi:TM2 domain-containing membrane protein YozV
MSAAPQNQPKRLGDPSVAMLLTWFIPGAGHLYLGKVRTGVLAFVIIEGLYGLGFWLSKGLFLNVLPVEMRSQFAGVLAPEMGNLGGLLMHIRQVGFLDDPVAWPSRMDLGMILTAASGVLNFVLMSHAHLEARAPGRSRVTLDPAAAAAACWLLPGLGHILQGRRARGFAVMAMLVGLFALGCVLAQGANLDRERHFYYWAGQFLLGLPAIGAELVHGHPRVTHDIPYVDAGVVLGCVAGMLNILMMLDVYGWSEQRQLGELPADESVPEAATAEEAGA